MSNVRILTHPEQTPEPLPDHARQTMQEQFQSFCLRRTGARPYQFAGREVAHVTGWNETSHLWHEINLFRDNQGRFVVDLRVFKKSTADQDMFHVVMVDSIDEAAAWLENYDPQQDVKVDIDFDGNTASMAEIALQAADLQLRILDAKRQYAAIVGDLFYALRLSV